MDAWVGWLLAAAALLVGWWSYGWQGLALAVSVIVFWLLLQFSRTVRLLRQASGAPIGHVPSAVMLHAKLREGLTLADVIRLAGSLGRKLADDPETFAWADSGEARVEIEFVGGRCRAWRLQRSSEPDSAAE